MAASTTNAIIACVAVFVALQSLPATSDFLSPLISPIFDNVCKDMNFCGKGTCKPSHNSTFAFECECDPGWKQARPQNDDNLKFLPCTFPNCTINHSCANAPSPVQQKAAKQANNSIFDPCHWTDCGGGSCNKTAAFSYSCLCDAGYYNLLNVSSLPCYRDCSIGMDCSNLGIRLPNPSASTMPAAGESTNQSEGTSILRGTSLWLVTLIAMAAVV